MALSTVRKNGYKVATLVTVVRDDQRVSVHGVSRELLRAQASRLGLPLVELLVDKTNSYEDVMAGFLLEQAEKGRNKISYGDLFLEDIRNWRDQLHRRLGFHCLYPIWQTPSRIFADEFIASGRKAVVVCVDTKRLDASFAGRDYDQNFLEDLPEGIDPCGENGEFHTFVYDGPDFSRPIPLERGAPEIREFNDPGHQFRFGFCDLSLRQGESR